MSKRVILDIGGKIFHTSASTIESLPDTMIAMLLSRHAGDALFIDRDPGNFRWIIHWYRTGILVDHTTVGVPQEVWDDEIAFYCISVGETDTVLGEQAPERRDKRIREKEQIFAKRCKEKLIELEKRKDTLVEQRREEYQKVLDYLISGINAEGRTGYDLVQPDERNLDQYPYDYPKAAIFNLSWLHSNMKEFIEFCAEYGFLVECKSYDPSYKGNHVNGFSPAKNVHFKRKHHHMRLVIWRRFLNQ